MELWRLYREAHGPGLDGTGGLYAPGRWHKAGSRVVYFGGSASIVVLERLAHLDPGLLPHDLVLAQYDGDIRAEEMKQAEVGDLGDLQRTRARGEEFLKANVSCVLRVPSVLVPEAWNFVFNPLHPDAMKIRLISSRPFKFDGRLL
ncbi:MAG: RES family NAD+ phosphorylase [Gammaproteobacteria bacterium]